MSNKGLLIKDIGEFALLKRLAGILGSAGNGGNRGVIRGIGDDAAVLQPTPGTRLLACSDLFLEGIHFDLSYFTPQQLGWKALAANVSDIAAMGGIPRWALVTLGVRPDLKVSFVENIYVGIAELAQKYGIMVVGGDTCLSPERLLLDICILAETYGAEVVYRSGAKEGDLILVTGNLGAAAAGLAYLRSEKKNDQAGVPAELLEAHLTPAPRVKEASILIKSGLVSALNDISDGLASELHEIMQASGCGGQIWAGRIPMSNATIFLAQRLNINPLDWALYGGEDYELVLTISGGEGSPLKARRLIRSLRKATGTELHVIGRVLPPSEGLKIVYPDEKKELLLPGGYNHFST